MGSRVGDGASEVAAISGCNGGERGGDGSGSGSGSGSEGVSSRGRRRMGTASRYGRMAGSTASGSARRFFQRAGVCDGCVANREYGNDGEWPGDGSGGAGGRDVVNGWRGVGQGAVRGRHSRSCLSSRTSL
ncbi:hypothetical protein AcW2_010364 [Taiwanofungus camphoratus]|nr:hypothetical protein AcW2_010364 [Antrodia cinnamomea]